MSAPVFFPPSPRTPYHYHRHIQPPPHIRHCTPFAGSYPAVCHRRHPHHLHVCGDGAVPLEGVWRWWCGRGKSGGGGCMQWLKMRQLPPWSSHQPPPLVGSSCQQPLCLADAHINCPPRLVSYTRLVRRWGGGASTKSRAGLACTRLGTGTCKHQQPPGCQRASLALGRTTTQCALLALERTATLRSSRGPATSSFFSSHYVLCTNPPVQQAHLRPPAQPPTNSAGATCHCMPTTQPQLALLLPHACLCSWLPVPSNKLIGAHPPGHLQLIQLLPLVPLAARCPCPPATRWCTFSSAWAPCLQR